LRFSALSKETRPKSANSEMVSVRIQRLIADDLRGFTYSKRETRRAYYGRELKHEAADEGDVVATLRQAAHTQLAEINRAWRRSFSSIPLDRDVESAVNRDVLTRNI
jgi:hypothetical protein